jgi:hypothetical protein
MKVHWGSESLALFSFKPDAIWCTWSKPRSDPFIPGKDTRQLACLQTDLDGCGRGHFFIAKFAFRIQMYEGESNENLKYVQCG